MTDQQQFEANVLRHFQDRGLTGADLEAEVTKVIQYKWSGDYPHLERLSRSYYKPRPIQPEDDPEFPTFLAALASAFQSLDFEMTTAQAQKNAVYAIEYAFSDGQNGWNKTWKINPPVWSAALAMEFAVRFKRYHIDNQDDR